MYFIFGHCNRNALRTARESAHSYPPRYPPNAKVIPRSDDRLRNTWWCRTNTQSPRSWWKNARRAYISIGRYIVEDGWKKLPSWAHASQSESWMRVAVPWTDYYGYKRYANSLHNRTRSTSRWLSATHWLFEWLLQQHEACNTFIAHILWKDETCFTRDGVFNNHNRHIWT